MRGRAVDSQQMKLISLTLKAAINSLLLRVARAEKTRKRTEINLKNMDKKDINVKTHSIPQMTRLATKESLKVKDTQANR